MQEARASVNQLPQPVLAAALEQSHRLPPHQPPPAPVPSWAGVAGGLGDLARGMLAGDRDYLEMAHHRCPIDPVAHHKVPHTLHMHIL